MAVQSTDFSVIENFTGPLDSTQLKDFVMFFQKSLLAKLEEFNYAFENENFRKSQDIAHMLKSSSNIIGAKKLAAHCEKYEKDTDTNNSEALALQAKKLIDEADNVLQDIQTKLSDLTE